MEIERAMVDQSAVVQVGRPLDLVLCETQMAGEEPYQLAFSCRFRGPAGAYIEVPGYWDAGFVVRFSPTCAGRWDYVSVSASRHLDGLTGTIEAVEAANAGRARTLRVWSAFPRHFLADGQPLYLMGYEANWLLLIDQGDASLARVSSFLDTIQPHGFNMVTVNVYAHHCPHWLDGSEGSDPRYIMAALAPWVGGNENPDYAQLDLAFFAHMDRVMALLLERGIYVHLMLQVYNKGVNWPELGSGDDERYWRYVVARYQAFDNVLWDTAKESYYRTAADTLNRVGLIRSLDGYGRLVTVHDANQPIPQPGGRDRPHYSAHRALVDEMVDFKSDQVHSDHYQDAVRSYRSPRPYINIEYGYERGVESLPTYGVQQDWQEVLRRTWLLTMGGAYPNYYYANTAWNLWLPLPEPPGYAAHGLYRCFWEDTAYWRLVPDNSPLEAVVGEQVLCRCERGEAYVFMVQTPEPFSATFEGAEAFRGQWLDPLSGRKLAQEISPGLNELCSPWPGQLFAVLYVNRAARCYNSQ